MSVPEPDCSPQQQVSQAWVFVINLARAVERRSVIGQELRRAGFLAGEVQLVEAVDGRELTHDLLERRGSRLFPRWRLPGSSSPFYARELKWGEVACSLSHLSVWSQIAASPEPFAVVLEDDVQLLTDAGTIRRELGRLTRLVADWDLCYLGRGPAVLPFCSREQPERAHAPNLVVPRFCYGAYAYAVSRGGAATLLAAGLERAIVPVDEFLPALYTPHPRQDVRRVFGDGDRLRAFALEPRLVREPRVQPSTIEPSAPVVAGT